MAIKLDCSLEYVSHKGLVQVSNEELEELKELGIVYGEKLEGLKFCEDTGYGKGTWVRFSKLSNVTKTLSYVHTNLWGPSQNETLGG